VLHSPGHQAPFLSRLGHGADTASFVQLEAELRVGDIALQQEVGFVHFNNDLL